MLDAQRVRLMDATWRQAFTDERVLETSDMGGVEPFGFMDGISQPEVDWSEQAATGAKADGYSNLVALGEVLLGYRNEYREVHRSSIHRWRGQRR